MIPNWTPPSLNRVIGKHFSVRTKLKRQTEDFLAVYCRDVPKANPPHYAPRRRLLVTIRWSRMGRLPDPDNLLKILLDSAKKCGLIVDDAVEWLECPMPTVIRCNKGDQPSTTLVFEDLQGEG